MKRSRLLHAASVALILASTVPGCMENGALDLSSGSLGVPAGGLRVRVLTSPADVARIHVAVTGEGIATAVEADLTKQPDASWGGSFVDVPPGTARTVTASAYDADGHVAFEGSATDVTVKAGAFSDVAITLKPVGSGSTDVNTAPHFTSLVHPESVLSNQTASLAATAVDPDTGAKLSYAWSVVQGGGSFAPAAVGDLPSDTAATTVYTPAAGYTGFAVIQVTATDGTASSSTTFPIAIGAGVNANISFATPPDITISSVERQALMPGGTTRIQYALTNPVQTWTPATMNVRTTWSDSCGGTFDAAPEDLAIAKGTSATRSVTYTAPSTRPASSTSCKLVLTVGDANNVKVTSTVNTWVDPTMVMFVSSATVGGDTFNGKWQKADAFCQELADAPTAVVPHGTYRALVSFGSISAKNRLIDAPFVRVDGTPIARNKAELFGRDLLNAVRTDEHNAFNGVTAVFTGTNGDGSTGSNCRSWTSTDAGDVSTAGISSAPGSPNWTNSGTFTCTARLPIYCVQQPSTN